MLYGIRSAVGAATEGSEDLHSKEDKNSMDKVLISKKSNIIVTISRHLILL